MIFATNYRDTKNLFINKIFKGLINLIFREHSRFISIFRFNQRNKHEPSQNKNKNQREVSRKSVKIFNTFVILDESKINKIEKKKKEKQNSKIEHSRKLTKRRRKYI